VLARGTEVEGGGENGQTGVKCPLVTYLLIITRAASRLPHWATYRKFGLLFEAVGGQNGVFQWRAFTGLDRGILQKGAQPGDLENGCLPGAKAKCGIVVQLSAFSCRIFKV